MVWLQFIEGSWVETEKVQLKILILILAVILLIEWFQKVIVSRGPYDPMIILGVTRLLQVILIFFIVITFFVIIILDFYQKTINKE